MISRIRYFFSFFIILSLFGFNENSFIHFPAPRNIKETEWITKSNTNGKVSKCYHYNQLTNIESSNLNLRSWSNDFKIRYDQKVNVKFISLSKIFDHIDTINLIDNKIYIPRKSIEYHDISKNRTELSTQNCLSYAIKRDFRDIKWNNLLESKWINQRINSLNISMELYALQNGLEG
jgi:hypothetical protein